MKMKKKKDYKMWDYLGKVSPKGSLPVRMTMQGNPSRSSYVCGTHSSFSQPRQVCSIKQFLMCRVKQTVMHYGLYITMVGIISKDKKSVSDVSP